MDATDLNISNKFNISSCGLILRKIYNISSSRILTILLIENGNESNTAPSNYVIFDDRKIY